MYIVPVDTPYGDPDVVCRLTQAGSGAETNIQAKVTSAGKLVMTEKGCGGPVTFLQAVSLLRSPFRKSLLSNTVLDLCTLISACNLASLVNTIGGENGEIRKCHWQRLHTFRSTGERQPLFWAFSGRHGIQGLDEAVFLFKRIVYCALRRFNKSKDALLTFGHLVAALVAMEKTAATGARMALKKNEALRRRKPGKRTKPAGAGASSDGAQREPGSVLPEEETEESKAEAEAEAEDEGASAAQADLLSSAPVRCQSFDDAISATLAKIDAALPLVQAKAEADKPTFIKSVKVKAKATSSELTWANVRSLRAQLCEIKVKARHCAEEDRARLHDTGFKIVDLVLRMLTEMEVLRTKRYPPIKLTGRGDTYEDDDDEDYKNDDEEFEVDEEEEDEGGVGSSFSDDESDGEGKGKKKRAPPQPKRHTKATVVLDAGLGQGGDHGSPQVLFLVDFFERVYLENLPHDSVPLLKAARRLQEKYTEARLESLIVESVNCEWGEDRLVAVPKATMGTVPSQRVADELYIHGDSTDDTPRSSPCLVVVTCKNRAVLLNKIGQSDDGTLAFGNADDSALRRLAAALDLSSNLKDVLGDPISFIDDTGTRAFGFSNHKVPVVPLSLLSSMGRDSFSPTKEVAYLVYICGPTHLFTKCIKFDNGSCTVNPRNVPTTLTKPRADTHCLTFLPGFDPASDVTHVCCLDVLNNAVATMRLQAAWGGNTTIHDRDWKNIMNDPFGGDLPVTDHRDIVHEDAPDPEQGLVLNFECCVASDDTIDESDFVPGRNVEGEGLDVLVDDSTVLFVPKDYAADEGDTEGPNRHGQTIPNQDLARALRNATPKTVTETVARVRVGLGTAPEGILPLAHQKDFVALLAFSTDPDLWDSSGAFKPKPPRRPWTGASRDGRLEVVECTAGKWVLSAAEVEVPPGTFQRDMPTEAPTVPTVVAAARVLRHGIDAAPPSTKTDVAFILNSQGGCTPEPEGDTLGIRLWAHLIRSTLGVPPTTELAMPKTTQGLPMEVANPGLQPYTTWPIYIAAVILGRLFKVKDTPTGPLSCIADPDTMTLVGAHAVDAATMQSSFRVGALVVDGPRALKLECFTSRVTWNVVNHLTNMDRIGAKGGVVKWMATLVAMKGFTFSDFATALMAIGSIPPSMLAQSNPVSAPVGLVLDMTVLQRFVAPVVDSAEFIFPGLEDVLLGTKRLSSIVPPTPTFVHADALAVRALLDTLEPKTDEALRAARLQVLRLMAACVEAVSPGEQHLLRVHPLSGTLCLSHATPTEEDDDTRDALAQARAYNVHLLLLGMLGNTASIADVAFSDLTDAEAQVDAGLPLAPLPFHVPGCRPLQQWHTAMALIPWRHRATAVAGDRAQNKSRALSSAVRTCVTEARQTHEEHSVGRHRVAPVPTDPQFLGGSPYHLLSFGDTWTLSWEMSTLAGREHGDFVPRVVHQPAMENLPWAVVPLYSMFLDTVFRACLGFSRVQHTTHSSPGTYLDFVTRKAVSIQDSGKVPNLSPDVPAEVRATLLKMAKLQVISNACNQWTHEVPHVLHKTWWGLSKSVWVTMGAVKAPMDKIKDLVADFRDLTHRSWCASFSTLPFPANVFPATRTFQNKDALRDAKKALKDARDAAVASETVGSPTMTTFLDFWGPIPLACAVNTPSSTRVWAGQLCAGGHTQVGREAGWQKGDANTQASALLGTELVSAYMSGSLPCLADGTGADAHPVCALQTRAFPITQGKFAYNFWGDVIGAVGGEWFSAILRLCTNFTAVKTDGKVAEGAERDAAWAPHPNPVLFGVLTGNDLAVFGGTATYSLYATATAGKSSADRVFHVPVATLVLRRDQGAGAGAGAGSGSGGPSPIEAYPLFNKPLEAHGCTLTIGHREPEAVKCGVKNSKEWAAIQTLLDTLLVHPDFAWLLSSRLKLALVSVGTMGPEGRQDTLVIKAGAACHGRQPNCPLLPDPTAAVVPRELGTALCTGEYKQALWRLDKLGEKRRRDEPEPDVDVEALHVTALACVPPFGPCRSGTKQLIQARINEERSKTLGVALRCIPPRSMMKVADMLQVAQELDRGYTCEPESVLKVLHAAGISMFQGGACTFAELDKDSEDPASPAGSGASERKEPEGPRDPEAEFYSIRDVLRRAKLPRQWASDAIEPANKVLENTSSLSLIIRGDIIVPLTSDPDPDNPRGTMGIKDRHPSWEEIRKRRNLTMVRTKAPLGYTRLHLMDGVFKALVDGHRKDPIRTCEVTATELKAEPTRRLLVSPSAIVTNGKVQSEVLMIPQAAPPTCVNPRVALAGVFSTGVSMHDDAEEYRSTKKLLFPDDVATNPDTFRAEFQAVVDSGLSCALAATNSLGFVVPEDVPPDCAYDPLFVSTATPYSAMSSAKSAVEEDASRYRRFMWPNQTQGRGDHRRRVEDPLAVVDVLGVLKPAGALAWAQTLVAIKDCLGHMANPDTSPALFWELVNDAFQGKQEASGAPATAPGLDNVPEVFADMHGVFQDVSHGLGRDRSAVFFRVLASALSIAGDTILRDKGVAEDILHDLSNKFKAGGEALDVAEQASDDDEEDKDEEASEDEDGQVRVAQTGTKATPRFKSFRATFEGKVRRENGIDDSGFVDAIDVPGARIQLKPRQIREFVAEAEDAIRADTGYGMLLGFKFLDMKVPKFGKAHKVWLEKYRAAGHGGTPDGPLCMDTRWEHNYGTHLATSMDRVARSYAAPPSNLNAVVNYADAKVFTQLAAGVSTLSTWAARFLDKKRKAKCDIPPLTAIVDAVFTIARFGDFPESIVEETSMEMSREAAPGEAAEEAANLSRSIVEALGREHRAFLSDTDARALVAQVSEVLSKVLVQALLAPYDPFFTLSHATRIADFLYTDLTKWHHALSAETNDDSQTSPCRFCVFGKPASPDTADGNRWPPKGMRDAPEPALVLDNGSWPGYNRSGVTHVVSPWGPRVADIKGNLGRPVQATETYVPAIHGGRPLQPRIIDLRKSMNVKAWKDQHPGEGVLPPMRALLPGSSSEAVPLSALGVAHAVGFMRNVLSGGVKLAEVGARIDAAIQPLWSPLAFHANVNGTVNAMSRTVATGVLLLSPDAPY